MSILLLTILGALIVPLFALFAVSRNRGWWRVLAGTLFACSLAALWMAAFECDQGWGLSASWIFCSSFMFTGVAVSLAGFIRWRFVVVPVAGVFFVAAVLGLHLFDLTPLKPSLRFQAAIRNGMTAAELRLALAREFPTGGRFTPPRLQVDDVPTTGEGQMFFYPNYAAAPVFVEFHDGRIVGQTRRASLFPARPLLVTVILVLGPLLAFCLCVKEWLRARRGPQEIGHGIDARPVLESLRRVRGDYFGQYHASHSEICRRRSLLAAARHVLSRLPYFRIRARQDSGLTGGSADP